MNKLVQWDEESTSRIADLWPDHTSSQIAAILCSEGIAATRNSVVGKINRMGLSIKNKTAIAANTRKTFAPQQPRIKRNKDGIGAVVQAINRGPKVKPEKFTPRAADVVSLRKPILELMAMECRWPDEERNADGLHTFCGHATLDGRSYCEAHQFIAIDQGRMAKIRAARKNMERAAA